MTLTLDLKDISKMGGGHSHDAKVDAPPVNPTPPADTERVKPRQETPFHYPQGLLSQYSEEEVSYEILRHISTKKSDRGDDPESEQFLAARYQLDLDDGTGENTPDFETPCGSLSGSRPGSLPGSRVTSRPSSRPGSRPVSRPQVQLLFYACVTSAE